MPTVNKVIRPWERRPEQKKQEARQHNKDTGFYRRAKWRKTRARVLEREPLCRHCKQKGRLTAATMVDHIRPINLKGPETPDWYDEENLQPLCDPCHAVKRSSERSSHRQ